MSPFHRHSRSAHDAWDRVHLPARRLASLSGACCRTSGRSCRAAWVRWRPARCAAGRTWSATVVAPGF